MKSKARPSWAAAMVALNASRIRANNPEASEINAERELNIPLAAANASAFGGDFPEVGAGGIKIHGVGPGDTTAAPTPVGVVDEIKRFGPELNACALGNRK